MKYFGIIFQVPKRSHGWRKFGILLIPTWPKIEFK